MSKLININDVFVDPEKIAFIFQGSAEDLFYNINQRMFPVPIDEEHGWTLESLVSFVNEQRA